MTDMSHEAVAGAKQKSWAVGRRDALALDAMRGAGIMYDGQYFSDGMLVPETPGEAASRMYDIIQANNPDGLSRWLLGDVPTTVE